jgi:hypothetical protein
MLAVDPQGMMWPPDMHELQPWCWICDYKASSSSSARSIHKAGMTEVILQCYIFPMLIQTILQRWICQGQDGRDEALD